MRGPFWWRAAAISAAGVLAASAVSGCGNGSSSDSSRPVAEIEKLLLPAEVQGLRVARESVKGVLKDARRPYINAVALYSFRREELLQATLQVSEFTADADYPSESFRRTVAQQIVGTSSELPSFRMGERTLYLGGNAKQSIAVWFDGPLVMVLAERAEYERPRALLRDLVTRDLREALR